MAIGKEFIYVIRIVFFSREVHTKSIFITFSYVSYLGLCASATAVVAILDIVYLISSEACIKASVTAELSRVHQNISYEGFFFGRISTGRILIEIHCFAVGVTVNALGLAQF
jgi:hypothetical protein